MFTCSSKLPTSATFPISSFLSNIMIFAAIFTFGCVAMTLPVSVSGESPSSKDLMSLLGKLKDAQRIRRHNTLDSSSAALSTNRRTGKTSSIDAAMLLQRATAAAAAGFDSGVTGNSDENSLDLRKRQGTWSFDYGLGGGRFGKRGGDTDFDTDLEDDDDDMDLRKRQGTWSFDYGLGGGRFGKRGGSSVDTDFDTDLEDDDDMDLRKRQGSWSADYGLGGGRFGKRSGSAAGDTNNFNTGLEDEDDSTRNMRKRHGRYGRDVDHVDPNNDIDVAVDNNNDDDGL